MVTHPDRNSEHESQAVDRSRRRFLGATAAGSLAAMVPASAGVVASDGDDTITIVHDTHFHGRFRDAEQDDLNIARYYTVVQDVLEDAENALFLGNGDDIAPSLLGLEYEGKHMIEALNYMDIDAVGVGNHEYDFGPDVAEARFEESEFPWVVANLLTDEDEPVPGTERWTTLEVGDLTVGVFGLVSENFKRLTDYPEEWQVLGYVEGSQEAVDALREEEGADVVVCASHVSSGVHFTIASEVEGLDAIVGSHSGVVFDEPQVEDGTIISEFGDEFDHVGSITIDSDGDLVDWQRTDLLPDGWDPNEEEEEYDEITSQYVSDIEADDGLMELYEEWQIPLDEELDQPFFTSETDLNGSFDNYAIETGFGNLITDAMLEIGEEAGVEIDIAAQNGGGIRGGEYEAGEIPGSAVMETLPFPNLIDVLEVTGQELIDFLGDQQRAHPSDQFGTQPAIQVSGISYEWWGHTDDSTITDDWEQYDAFGDGISAVKNVFVNGEPVDPDETYVMATNDYFRENEFGIDDDDLEFQSNATMGAFVLDVLEEWGEVAPEREHRMIRVDEDVGDASVEDAGDEVHLSFAFPESGTEVLEDSFRAVIRTGDELEATGVDANDDTVTVSFDADALEELASSVDEPVLRVFGGYESDDDFWDYDFDIPTSDGYDHLKLRSGVDDAAVLEALSDEGDDDDDDHDDADDDADDHADDADDGVADDTDVAGDDGSPGFGPLAALAGAGGGAYLYSRVKSDDTDEEHV